MKTTSTVPRVERRDNAKTDEHQEPLSIIKSKPLKSERDRQQVEREKQLSLKPRKSLRAAKNPPQSGFKVPQIQQYVKQKFREVFMVIPESYE